MRRLFIALAALALLAALGAVPATADPGTGELQASFNAGLSGGSAHVRVRRRRRFHRDHQHTPVTSDPSNC